MKNSIAWSDTICALATPPGIAGLAIIRVSGSSAVAVCGLLFESSVSAAHFKDHTIHYGWWRSGDVTIDSVTLTYFQNPHSYTGEDVIEIGCHGGLFVTEQILNSLFTHDVRLAEPGEFTKRAFLNGKLDLLQVEAVADIISSQSRMGAQTAARQLAGGFTHRLHSLRSALLEACSLLEVELDFSEEGYEFVSRNAFEVSLNQAIDLSQSLVSSAINAKMLRGGFSCSVVGYPNAGKSSLFNSLLDKSRAIVSEIPGTTRDYLEDAFILEGFVVNLFDTAGLRNTEDIIELQGIKLTASVIEQSDLVLLVNDASLGFDYSDNLYNDLVKRFGDVKISIIQNKMDLADGALPTVRSGEIPCTATDLKGVAEVRHAITSAIKSHTTGFSDALVNQRQAALLKQVIQSLESARDGLDNQITADLISVDVRNAIRLLGEITGETWSPDVLESVFSNFCIGK